MLEEKKASRWGRWLILVVLVLVLIYVIADGWVMNKLKPDEVVAVYEPGGVKALVNKSDKSIRRWKWPRIPGTSIGVKEEPIKDEVKTVTSRFALYTSEEVTGKEEDKEYAQAYVVDMEIEVKDWQKFLTEIDLEKINEERKKAGPFVTLVKDRFEVIAGFIEDVIKRGEATDRLGKPLRSKEGYPAMNLTTRINYAYSQLANRRNFLIALLDRYHLETGQEITEYLEEKIPWYWFAGPDTYEFLVQQYKEIQESIFSPYLENIAPEAAQQRLIFGEDRLELYQKAYQAYGYEKFLMERERNIEELEKRRSDYAGEEEAEKVARSFKKFLEWQENELRFITDGEQLRTLYNSFLEKLESNLTFILRESELEFVKEGIEEAKEKFAGAPLEETGREKAKEIEKGVQHLIIKEQGKEFYQVSDEELSQFLSVYLVENNLQELPSSVLDYVLLLLREDYFTALSDEVEKARKFLDIEIVKEYYLELKSKLETERIDPAQLSRTVIEYISGQQYLFSTFVGLISLLWQEEKIEWDRVQWERVKEEELIPFFEYYSQANTELALSFRGITSEENRALWQAAIEEVLGGEDIASLRSFTSHKVEEGDTLAELAKEYDVDWPLVFNRRNRDFARRSLTSEDDKVRFDKLLAQAFETGDYRAVYELVKETPLKAGESIIINKVEEFTPQWFEEGEGYRKKREATVKKYIYRWIEEFAPRVIEEYLLVSPWLDYIERTYGVKIRQINLHIERDSMFTRDGQPKDEYYDLYYSKYVSAVKSEKEIKEE